MLKYLIVQLDDSSTSFCHYNNAKSERNLISLDKLRAGIFWSMKENLTLQFIYPDYEIPTEYKNEIEKTFHADIVSSVCEDKNLRDGADVVVFNSFADVHDNYPLKKEQSFVIRTSFAELFESSDILYSILPKVDRIVVVITDILSFKKEDEGRYAEYLDNLASKIIEEYKNGHKLQVNLLTDRILLEKMNNCNAGDETITLCPDGNFYVCPAFYNDAEASFVIGDVKDGPDIKNPQLYKISHAPICRKCDAYQCRRCIWQNKKSTLEVNTPSHEQCVVSHIEREASRKFLENLLRLNLITSDVKIEKLDYLDPFEVAATII